MDHGIYPAGEEIHDGLGIGLVEHKLHSHTFSDEVILHPEGTGGAALGRHLSAGHEGRDDVQPGISPHKHRLIRAPIGGGEVHHLRPRGGDGEPGGPDIHFARDHRGDDGVKGNILDLDLIALQNSDHPHHIQIEPEHLPFSGNPFERSPRGVRADDELLRGRAA